jgi:hypothetical protein
MQNFGNPHRAAAGRFRSTHRVLCAPPSIGCERWRSAGAPVVHWRAGALGRGQGTAGTGRRGDGKPSGGGFVAGGT